MQKRVEGGLVRRLDGEVWRIRKSLATARDREDGVEGTAGKSWGEGREGGVGEGGGGGQSESEKREVEGRKQ